MTGSLGATTRTDVAMYAYQTLNQNAVERRSSLKIPQMKELACRVIIAKKAFKVEDEVMTARFSNRDS
jgi:predicted sulfurtransferase